MRSNQITTFYRSEQVATAGMEMSYSKSPLKPRLVVENLRHIAGPARTRIEGSFSPFNRQEFLLAHTKGYVEDFFHGKNPLCSSNSLPWTLELAESVRFTNASLYHAVRHSILSPGEVTFSPTSGFHHAQPTRGSGFCTFSGQVIASLKLYKEFGVSGAWVDLDGHFGNSIEDSRAFCTELDTAVPRGCNINPTGRHREYILDLKNCLAELEKKIHAGKIHYVVFCHGADSHQDDDAGVGQCTTDEWLECSNIFYRWVRAIDAKRHSPLPLSLSLFGGYRADDYDTVIALHVADILTCANVLCGAGFEFGLKRST